MKITPKQYALGLLHALSNKQEAEITAIVDKFVALLVQNNDSAKADKIIKELSTLWNKEHGVIESEITTAKSLDKETLDSVKTFLLKISGGRTIEMSERIDATILGGVIMRYGDTVLDYSTHTKINDLISAIKQ